MSLARPRTGDDQQGALRMGDLLLLPDIQLRVQTENYWLDIHWTSLNDEYDQPG